jgi:hypothetical protein
MASYLYLFQGSSFICDHILVSVTGPILISRSDQEIQELSVMKNVFEQPGGFCEILKSLEAAPPGETPEAAQARTKRHQDALKALDNAATIINRPDNLAFFEAKAEDIKGDFVSFILNKGTAQAKKPSKAPRTMLEGVPNPPFPFLAMNNYLRTTSSESQKIAAEIDAQILPFTRVRGQVSQRWITLINEAEKLAVPLEKELEALKTKYVSRCSLRACH